MLRWIALALTVVRGIAARDGAGLVRWETQELPPAVEIAVRPVDGGDAQMFTGTTETSEIAFEYNIPLVELPDLAGTYHLHSVVADGLSPATCYRYEIVGYEEHGGRFCTMHDATDHTTPIDFLVLGDTSVVLRTADLLPHVLQPPPEFVVHVGDIQYYDALLETWQLFFREMSPLLEVGGFFPTIGNHEDEREGEFEATYARYFENPSRDGTTSQYHYETGGVHFFAVNSEDDIGEYDTMFTWLASELEEAEQTDGFRCSIVYFHRPIYTLARHAPSLSLRAVLEPIITSHRVPLVLQGHNHVYERFVVGDTTYIVSGGGGSARYDLDESAAEFPDEVALRAAGGAWHHGVRMRIEGNTIRGSVIDIDGTEQETFEIVLAS